jgi:hypothetical protein
MDVMSTTVDLQLPIVSLNTCKLAIQRVNHYTDERVQSMSKEAYTLVQAFDATFTGGSFCFVGDFGPMWETFMVFEAGTIGSRKKTKNYVVGRTNDGVKVYRLK